MNTNGHELIRRLRFLCASLCLFVAVNSFASDIKKDEQLVFFPTIASRTDHGKAWDADIHGWIYEPERRPLTLALFRVALGVKKEEFDAAEDAILKERARTFLVDNERGKQIAVRIGENTYPLGKSAANGHLIARVRIPANEVERLRQGDTLTFRAVTDSKDARIFAGEIHLVDETGLSVVTDIDDTIKVSEVNDRKALLQNTFVRPYQPVSGMADAYEAWTKSKSAKFHYVSASPWQLYAPLLDFVLSSGFPRGTFHLKQFRVKDESFFKLFESPDEYKLSVIEPILRRFPKRQFVLVGDSEEKDPEAYGVLARKYPKQVVGIFIRDVTKEAPEAERYRKAFKNLPPTLWKTFRDPKEIIDAVR